MIEINNLTRSKINKKFLEGVAKKVLKEENKEGVDLSVVLVGEARMREINRGYRGKNKATDVLSFGNGLNEIVICPREVKKNVKKYKSAFQKELVRVLIHGILHLLGYKHKKGGREAKKMEEREEYYLSLFNF
ncbi:MAG: rRNA maturation RNase YbeY [Candidatus Nealsonbacteria bacterium]|nr:rRNA maturation RNase YbeY [Candidatus Nealsonbacteria bacterium]